MTHNQQILNFLTKNFHLTARQKNLMKLQGFQSPKSKNIKKQNHFDLTGLNSYKVDTSILTDKAKSLQRLKNKLESQISNFQNTQISYQNDLEALKYQVEVLNGQNIHLKEQTIQLKDKIRKLQSRSSMAIDNIQNKQLDTKKKQLEHLTKHIYNLQKKLVQKDLVITELEQYKKMYQIEVQNKHNMMDFYEMKISNAKMDNKKLLNTYEAKISVLQSGFSVNNIQNQLPQIESKNQIKKAKTHNVLIDESKIQNAAIQSITSLKINQKSRIQKKNRLNRQSKMYESLQSNRLKNLNKQIQQSQKIQMHNKTKLHYLMRQIFVNLKRKGIKSENIRNFKNIQIFVNIENPSSQIMKKILNETPLGRINMSGEDINEAIKQLRQQLFAQYAHFSENLAIQSIIDKIQDFQIANQFNAEDQSFIIAGLNKIH